MKTKIVYTLLTFLFIGIEASFKSKTEQADY